jgi:UDP-N-acetylmuramoyl-tripeptide--D-alanyl-D-alanine ligase
MIPLRLAEVADAVGGRLDGGADPDRVVSGLVVTDSRSVGPGDLFVAVVGEHHDAHHFAAPAMQSGAVAVLASRPLEVPCIVVDDTVLALGRLARRVVQSLDLVVVAVTGSSGKTSTKDLLAQVLPLLGPTVAPQGSFNTEIGLPVTALTVDARTRVLVSEMGSRGIGHIRYLTTITPPRVGIVLNVGSAHVGEFGSREAIALSKRELVEALPPAEEGGLAVLNADDPLVLEMAERTSARVLTYGVDHVADVRAVDVVLDDQGRASFDVAVDGLRAPVTLALHGRHQVSNAVAVAAAAVGLGLELDVVARALSGALPASRWRMDVTLTSGGVTVVNDAYNANPESMRAALEALRAMSGPAADGRPRRSWAVLGEMRELGDAAPDEHEAVGALAIALGVDRVVVVGEAARGIHGGAVREGGSAERSLVVADVDAAVRLLRDELRTGDVVLVKASRGAALERVALALLEDAT